MIKRENFPIAARTCDVNITWNANNTESIDFVGGHLTFNNVNVTTAGYVQKEKTTLPFAPGLDIDWPEGLPPEIEATLGSPSEAFRTILGILYESNEHQYRLGLKERPVQEGE